MLRERVADPKWGRWTAWLHFRSSDLLSQHATAFLEMLISVELSTDACLSCRMAFPLSSKLPSNRIATIGFRATHSIKMVLSMPAARSLPLHVISNHSTSALHALSCALLLTNQMNTRQHLGYGTDCTTKAYRRTHHNAHCTTPSTLANFCKLPQSFSRPASHASKQPLTSHLSSAVFIIAQVTSDACRYC